MHRAVYHALPEKKLKHIFLLFLKVFWFNFLFPKIRKFQSERKGLSPDVHKLTVLAEKLKGEKEILEAELTATPHIKGCISEYTKRDKSNSERTWKYHVLRWSESGQPRSKHIVKKKRNPDDLTLDEAQELIQNAEKAISLKQEIKERTHKLNIIQDKLTIITGKLVDIKKPLVRQVLQINFLGRQEEFEKLEYNVLYNIPTLIIGEPGIGKSKLVSELMERIQRRSIVIENLRAPKPTLLENVIWQLHKEGNLKLIDDNYSLSLGFDELKKLFRNKTIIQLAEVVRDSIFSSDYVIIFDSLTGLTQANKIIIEKLFETGNPIIACSNKIKKSIELESLYRKFSQIELKPINKKTMLQIIDEKTKDIEAGDWLKLLQTKIMNACCGNPGIADKMIKEAHSLSYGGELSLSQIRAIQEPYLERKYFDLTPFVIISIACFGILRFIGIGTNDTLLYIVGGSAFIIFMAFGRLLSRGGYKR